jgi:hypothetical protein
LTTGPNKRQIITRDKAKALMKKRSKNSKTERAGLIAVEGFCNQLDLIWRDLLQEDVGMDGTIEIALGEFPTGKLVGVQVKSGVSYIRSETDTEFRFYADQDDLDYWSDLSIPLFLFVHDPRVGTVYWVDIKKYLQSRLDTQLGTSLIEFSKLNQLNSEFESYLHARFDLLVYNDLQFDDIYRDLQRIVYQQGEGDDAVSVSAVDLFIEGLWGLCTKIQFHSSLLSDRIRKIVQHRNADIHVTYTFDRDILYPYFTKYFNIIAKHHLAVMDISDINHSLYAKSEYPTFIAPLTTNGRKFVDYLRRKMPGVRDNQYMSFSLADHLQIEVFSKFEIVGEKASFGPCTDVLCIRFNKYLDYYHLQHYRSGSTIREMTSVVDQSIYFHELCQYIDSKFEDTPKDNIVLRHLDIPLTPLACWLERWYEDPRGFSTSVLAGKTASELVGFADELAATMAPVGVMTISEPPLPSLPRLPLLNGEFLQFASS